MEVPQEELRAYMEKWGLTEDGECSRTLTRAEVASIINFSAALSVRLGGLLKAHPDNESNP